MSKSVFDQLAEYCNCIDVEESDVNELIDLISMYTGWTTEPCETFLTADRKEVIDLPDCLCDCDVYTFEPHYYPFEPDSFTFTLIEQNGLNETATVITDYIYSMADENFKIELPLPKCGCKPNCGCESKYKLLVTYTAGYDEIPDCLLPVFCEALQWIHIKNVCDCAECEPCNANDYGNNENTIDFTTITGTLQDFFVSTLSMQYRRQLALIAIYSRKHDLWGFVV